MSSQLPRQIKNPWADLARPKAPEGWRSPGRFANFGDHCRPPAEDFRASSIVPSGRTFYRAFHPAHRAGLISGVAPRQLGRIASNKFNSPVRSGVKQMPLLTELKNHLGFGSTKISPLTGLVMARGNCTRNDRLSSLHIVAAGPAPQDTAALRDVRGPT